MKAILENVFITKRLLWNLTDSSIAAETLVRFRNNWKFINIYLWFPDMIFYCLLKIEEAFQDLNLFNSSAPSAAYMRQ